MGSGYEFLVAVQQLVWLISLYIIFVHNHKRKKQFFVKVIWLFISVAQINLAVIYFYLTPLSVNGELSDHELHKVDIALKILKFITQILEYVSYWLFAVEYLRLALKFPLILCQL